MAVILVLDRANIRGKKRPRVRAIVCDGYNLYAENEEMTEFMSNGPVRPRLIAQQMLSEGVKPLGEAIYHELREELARQGAEAQARAREKKEHERNA